jgi:hypothetical protein
MDLVYICRDGDNEELRYSIRSAVANLPHDNIWVVGGKPDWYVGNHVRLKQNTNKYDNARANLAAITRHYDVSDDFILMNDDFYAIRTVEAVEPMHRGLMQKHIDMIEVNLGYKQLVQETLDTLVRIGVEHPISYELHVPMVMNKNKLAKILRMPGLWRSLYGNIYGINGEEYLDVKVHNTVDIDKLISNPLPYISSHDSTFQGILDGYFTTAFPLPSKYEKSPQQESNLRPRD